MTSLTDACSVCDCKAYSASMHECDQCGVEFAEQQARAGHEYCKNCADEHRLCVWCGEPSDDDFCLACVANGHDKYADPV